MIANVPWIEKKILKALDVKNEFCKNQYEKLIQWSNRFAIMSDADVAGNRRLQVQRVLGRLGTRAFEF